VHGLRKGGPWILKILPEKVVFLVLSGKKSKFHHFWPPLEKFWKNSLVAPPGKNHSDANGLVCFTRKSKVGLQWIYFYCIFTGNTALHDVNWLLGRLPELSKDKNQLSSYALSRHDCFNVLTNINLFAFILTRMHACVYNSRSSLGTRLCSFEE